MSSQVLGAGYASVVESDVPLHVRREVSVGGYGGDSQFGQTAETAVEAPRLQWFFAEGATHSGFNLFYVIVNPNPRPTHVWVKFLRQDTQAPVLREYDIAAFARRTIWVDQEIPLLAQAEVGAVVSSVSPNDPGDAHPPVVVERVMYLANPVSRFAGATASKGTDALQTTWYLAEGATGSYFDAFVLMVNPWRNGDARVRITYLLPDGSSVVRQHVVPQESRTSVWVDREDQRLADTAFAARVESLDGVGIAVERTMWWPGPTPATWYEGHTSAAAPALGTEWMVVPSYPEDYLTIANFAGTPAFVLVQSFCNGSGVCSAAASKTYEVAPGARFSLLVQHDLPYPGGAFVMLESIGTDPVPILVEHSSYRDGASKWGAGTNTLAFRLR